MNKLKKYGWLLAVPLYAGIGNIHQIVLSLASALGILAYIEKIKHYKLLSMIMMSLVLILYSITLIYTYSLINEENGLFFVALYIFKVIYTICIMILIFKSKEA